VSDSKRILDQQLAEVSAGTRRVVDRTLQESVARDEERAKEEGRHHQKRSLEVSENAAQSLREQARSASDAARAAADTARAAQEAADLARETLRRNEQHQAALEAYEQERLENDQAHQAKMEDNANENLKVAKNALRIQEEEATSNENARTQQQRILELQAHEARLKGSACYTSAIKLLELLRLEQVQQETTDLEQMFAAVPGLLTRLDTQLQVELAADKHRVAATKAESARAIESIQGAHRADVAAHEAAGRLHDLSIQQASNAVELTRRALLEVGLSADPRSWFGDRSNRRKELKSQLVERSKALSAQKQLADQHEVMRPRPSSEEMAAIRPATELQLTMAAAEKSGVLSEFSGLQHQLWRWFTLKPRSRWANTLCGPAFADNPTEPHIDYEACVILDHQRLDGVVSLAYPGLGELPFGSTLMEMVAKIQLLKVSQKALETSGPEGFRPYQTLADRIGAPLLPNGCGDLSLGSDEPPTVVNGCDPLYHSALEVVLTNKRASISLVQRHLRIGYNHASSLLDAMEVAGVVSAPSASGQRELYSDGVNRPGF
jgi:hypothetical protein